MQYLNSTKLIEIYLEIDDFMKGLEAFMSSHALTMKDYRIRSEKRKMNHSEMMSIVVFYHVSGFKCFKWYYNIVIRGILKSYFPQSYSYNRFIELMGELNIYLLFFMTACRLSPPSQGNYIDSKKLVVSHNRRIHQHQTHKGLARRGKSSTGWFFGFKLHLIINHLGEIVLFKFTSGNVADNNHDLLWSIAQKVRGFLFGDKGYLTKIAADLRTKGLHLITKLRKNMKPQQLTPQQKYYMKHRGLIETVFDILKHQLDMEHSRNRSTKNYFVNVIAALIAYTFLDHTPAIPTYKKKMKFEEFNLLEFKLI